MNIIIDERENSLYVKCYEMSNDPTLKNNIIVSKEVLPIGDIIIETVEHKQIMCIERKSLSDLLASIKDGRYEEQSYRLLNSTGLPPHNIFYIIEGMFSQIPKPKDKRVVYSAITSLNYFKGFSVMRTCSVNETAELLFYMADKIHRNLLKGVPPAYLLKACSNLSNSTINSNSSINANSNNDTNTLSNVLFKNNDNITEPETTDEIEIPDQHGHSAVDYCSVVKKVKKDNITTENIGHIILSQIPGISSITSIAIMKNFRSFPHFITELQQNHNVLDNITIDDFSKTENTIIKKRKINKNAIISIKKYFLDGL
jgi:ERCC4-type nuclease